MESFKKSLMLCMVIFFMIGGAFAQNGNWPRFYGSDVNNRSSETDLLKAWPEEGLSLLWTAGNIGQGYANVAIADGRLVTAGNIDRQTFIMAFDLDGTLLWKVLNMPAEDARLPMQENWIERFHGVKSTPTIDQESIYHLNEVGRLAAFDLKNGKERWAVDLVAQFDGKPSPCGYAESVVIDGNRLFVQPGGMKHYLVALDKRTGRRLWSSSSIQDSVASYVTPVIAVIAGKKQLITMTPFAAVGLDLQSGELLWRHAHMNKDKENIETPLVFNDQVVISSAYGQKMDCFRVFKTGQVWSTKTVWTQAQCDNLHGGLVYWEGYLYGVACRGGRWFCVEAESGKIVYREAGIGLGELTFADGRLYCLSHKGQLCIAPATPDGFVPAGLMTLADDIQGQWYIHPVVCGGRLYVRHGHHLYVYHIAAKQ